MALQGDSQLQPPRTSETPALRNCGAGSFALQNAQAAVVDCEMQDWGDYQRGVFPFDYCGAFDYVPGAQRFVGEKWSGAKIFFGRPIDRALAFAGCCWAGAF